MADVFRVRLLLVLAALLGAVVSGGCVHTATTFVDGIYMSVCEGRLLDAKEGTPLKDTRVLVTRKPIADFQAAARSTVETDQEGCFSSRIVAGFGYSKEEYLFLGFVPVNTGGPPSSPRIDAVYIYAYRYGKWCSVSEDVGDKHYRVGDRLRLGDILIPSTPESDLP